MEAHEWGAHEMKCFGFQLWAPEKGRASSARHPLCRDSWLVLMNAGHEAVPFALPEENGEEGWLVVMDTSACPEAGWNGRARARGSYLLGPHSLSLLGAPDAETRGVRREEAAPCA